MTNSKEDVKQTLETMFQTMTLNFKQNDMQKAIALGLDKIQFSDPEEYHDYVCLPLYDAMEGALSLKFPEGLNYKLEWVYHNYNRLYFNLRWLFEKHEGSACCADKARTVMARYAKFLTDGLDIEFNPNAEYTYHHPKKVLMTHQAIIDYFDRAYDTFYGKLNNDP